MPTYKKYKNKQYESFLQDSFNNNYGISEEAIAKYFVNSGTYVVGQYGLTVSNMLSTYIPTLKAGLDGGYVFFLLYAITEGGGAGNWINHYTADTASNGLDCMLDDIDYLNSVTKDFPPCKSAKEVLNWTEYVDDVQGSTDAFYDKLKDKTIGALWMPSTMAGNSWVWGTKWTLAHQGAQPNCYFGNPYDTYLSMVSELGGDLSFDDKLPQKPTDNNTNNDGGGTSNGGGSNVKPKPDVTDDDTNDTTVIDKLIDSIKDGAEAVVDEVKKMQSHNLYATTYNQSIMSNKNYIAKRVYNNVIKLKTTSFFDKFINNAIDGIDNIKPDDGDNGDGTTTDDTGDNSQVGGGDETEQPVKPPKPNPVNNNYPKPVLNDKYYTTLNPFWVSNYGMPNCTCYAYGRAYEILKKDPHLPTGNGATWYDSVTGYEKGQTPKKGAIACYSGGQDGYGHVSFIEKVKTDTVIISQSDFYGTKPYGYSTYELPHNCHLSGLNFMGFIYVMD